MTIYENTKLRISSQNSKVYIQVFESDTTPQEINELIQMLPQVKLQSFTSLKNALIKASGKLIPIGQLKPEVQLNVSSDEMTAYVTINLPKDVFELCRTKIMARIHELLKQNRINAGIISDALDNGFTPGKKLLIAQGQPALDGIDAQYNYYKLSEKTPKLGKLDKTDHYELQLIDQVKKGDWLGEKTPATPGRNGFTVKGRTVYPKAGREYMLRYDMNSVYCSKEGKKEVLRALFDGAVKCSDGKMSVDKHLHIKGDVDYSTGNIKFDGYVTIEGTVQDKFSVQATKDIEIKGDMGIGAVTRVESTGGSIYVRGGINGKKEGLVIASENIYAKFSNEAVLIAGNSIQIGVYSINSILRATEVIIDPGNGRVIGGEIHATHKIIAGSIGNDRESKTRINVEGFEREQIAADLKLKRNHLSEIITKVKRVKTQLEEFEKHMNDLDMTSKTTYRNILRSYEDTLHEILMLKRDIEKLENTLKTRGEGEICILKNIYPSTLLEIKHMRKQVGSLMSGTFYAENRRLHTVIN